MSDEQKERREKIAIAVLAGMVSNTSVIAMSQKSAPIFAVVTVAFADALIAELDKDADQ